MLARTGRWRVSGLWKPELRVFIYSEAIDMRAGFGKLQALVAEKMKGKLFEGQLFLFLGKNRRRVKLLRFDGTGLCLFTKRLDRGLFMEVSDLFGVREIAMEELERLLDGANLRVVFAARSRSRENQEVA
jgi:transposase